MSVLDQILNVGGVNKHTAYLSLKGVYLDELLDDCYGAFTIVFSSVRKQINHLLESMTIDKSNFNLKLLVLLCLTPTTLDVLTLSEQRKSFGGCYVYRAIFFRQFSRVDC